jgi:hypothetical protein
VGVGNAEVAEEGKSQPQWKKLIYSVCVGANSEGEVSKTFYH